MRNWGKKAQFVLFFVDIIVFVLTSLYHYQTLLIIFKSWVVGNDVPTWFLLLQVQDIDYAVVSCFDQSEWVKWQLEEMSILLHKQKIDIEIMIHSTKTVWIVKA